MKDAATDLWMLPLGTPDMTTQHVTSILPLVASVIANAHVHLTTQIAFFTTQCKTKPTVSTLPISHCVAHGDQLY